MTDALLQTETIYSILQQRIVQRFTLQLMHFLLTQLTPEVLLNPNNVVIIVHYYAFPYKFLNYAFRFGYNSSPFRDRIRSVRLPPYNTFVPNKIIEYTAVVLRSANLNKTPSSRTLLPNLLRLGFDAGKRHFPYIYHHFLR